ncbi:MULTISPECIES: hypothetical protein [unclassified Mesorhizobium]|uniref:hypothetical protein n=1 Tax=unclassified Mesorhizobium TaxID=325217 RepID=UPI0003CFA28F|nr:MULTISPECIES: hypothetical protein [unclassified Mesorhizobium]ESZ26743.1 hypothetical protein X734_13805 [Mesorhizobium sp. L2C084A000]RUZ75469.1 hypothetical protein EN943_20545 [Mesorhizobium sp. M7A.F.Ca.US.006.01.1.1]
MAKIIPENKARQGRWGWHGFRILIAALLLVFAAWGIAEIYGVLIKTPTSDEQHVPTPPNTTEEAPAG